MKTLISLLFIILMKTTLGTVSYNWTYCFDAGQTAWNPFKGLVPYYYYGYPRPGINFPHSMENQYIPMKSLMMGPNSFDFSSIDSILNNVATRNHHAILRVYVDYPGNNLNQSLPDFLWNGLTKYSGTADQGLFPDYNNQTLINAMVTLIRTLGKRYDGDVRIAFWQVGFLGHWGEWHTYPNSTYFASPANQQQILLAFNSSFVKTKVQVRYFQVTGTNNATSWNMGFHDDSFFQDTYGQSWMFYNQSVAVGAISQWRSQPIGGEVRPEFWSCVFSKDPVFTCANVTTLTPLNWTTCVQLTHASYQWLASAFYTPGFTGSDYNRAINGSIMLGYTFFVSGITVNEISCAGSLHVLRIGVTMANVGVAPFYYPLNLNTKAMDSVTKSLISQKSIPIPISNQLDQKSFIYYFDMAVKSNTIANFSVWLSSQNLVGNQTIVFANAGIDSTGVIQLPAISIDSCIIENLDSFCVCNGASISGGCSQGTAYTMGPNVNTFYGSCVTVSSTT